MAKRIYRRQGTARLKSRDLVRHRPGDRQGVVANNAFFLDTVSADAITAHTQQNLLIGSQSAVFLTPVSGSPTTPSVRAVSTQAGFTNATTVVGNKPTGTASGDLLVALVWAGGAGNAAAQTVSMSGWTPKGLAQDYGAGDNYTTGVYVFMKDAGGAEPSTYTATTTASGGASCDHEIMIFAYIGAAPTASQPDVTPVTNTHTADVAGGILATTAAQNTRWPTITTVTRSALIYAAAMWDGVGTGVATTISGIASTVTKRTSYNNAAGFFFVADGIQAAAGAEGAGNFANNGNNASSSSKWAAIAVAVAGASGGGGGAPAPINADVGGNKAQSLGVGQTATATVTGSAGSPVSGAATQSLGVQQAAAATVLAQAAAAQSLGVQQTAVGTTPHAAVAAQSLGVQQVATAAVLAQAQATQSLGVLGSGVAVVLGQAAANQSLLVGQAAAGTAFVQGSASQSVGVGQTATGTVASAVSDLVLDFVARTYRRNGTDYSDEATAVTGGVFTFSRTGAGYYTDAAGLMSSVASGVMRRGSKGLLLEPASTNLVTNSEDLGNAANSANAATATANAGAAPDGNTTADSFVENGTNVGHYWQYDTNAISYVSGRRYTQSFYVKAGAGAERFVQIVWSAAAFGGLNFQTYSLKDGRMITIGGTTQLTAVVGFGTEDLGNGWYRVWASQVATTTASGSAAIVSVMPLAQIGTRIGSFAGATSNTSLVWGAMLEENNGQLGGAPTAYIPTSGSSASRGAEALSIALPTGTWDVKFTFIDKSTWVDHAQTGTYVVPTVFDKPIAKIEAVAPGGPYKLFWETTGRSEYLVPAAISNYDLVEAVGPGGAHGNTSTLVGAGGGAYANKANLAVTPGSTVGIQVPLAAGGNYTAWNDGAILKAAGGSNGGPGLAANSVGDVTNSGGAGGAAGATGGGGGGGAGGPAGPGGAGGAGTSGNQGGGGGGANGGTAGEAANSGSAYAGAGGDGPTGTAGGARRTTTGVGNAGSNGSGGSGGKGSANIGGANSHNAEWDADHGLGSGPGGSGATAATPATAAQTAGAYGNGAPGAGNAGGTFGYGGGKGLLVFSYTPISGAVGQATQSLGVQQVATAAVPAFAASASSLSVDQTAAATVLGKGSAAQSVGVGQTAVGTVVANAAATQALSVGQSAAGTVFTSVIAAQDVGVQQAAAATVVIKGQAAQSVGIGQAALATVPVSGSAGQSVGVAQIASGAAPIVLSAVQSLGVSQNAISEASPSIHADATQQLSVSQTAIGTSVNRGTATQSLGVSQSAVATAIVTAAVVQSLGVQQAATARGLVAAAAAQALGVQQAAAGTVIVKGTPVQSIGVGQTATISLVGNTDVVQSLGVQQVATATVVTKGSAAQSLSVSQAAAGAAPIGAASSGSLTLSQAATARVRVALAAAQSIEVGQAAVGLVPARLAGASGLSVSQETEVTLGRSIEAEQSLSIEQEVSLGSPTLVSGISSIGVGQDAHAALGEPTYEIVGLVASLSLPAGLTASLHPGADLVAEPRATIELKGDIPT